MKLKLFLFVLLTIICNLPIKAGDREVWVDYLTKISYPILKNAAEDSLSTEMPVYTSKTKPYQYLEALGRTICGIAPWLELGPDTTTEGIERQKFIRYATKAISNAVNPESADYMNFSEGSQPLVDAAYLSMGLLRAPQQLWGELDSITQKRLISELKKTRKIQPGQTNWLLFASMVEAFLLEFEGECNKSRLVDGVEKFIFLFNKGDGLYGDGANFAMDYYNSFVIHPMLLSAIKVGKKHGLHNFGYYEQIEISRLQRYAVLQERMISPDGTYPVWGRTLICRTGVFHAFCETILSNILSPSISYGQARAALTAVLIRQLGNEKTFDKKGFMTVGFVGKQDSIAEEYVSSGSAYHCATFFLPLGLKANHPFWTDTSEKWTSAKAFNGEEISKDHRYAEKNGVYFHVLKLWVNFKYIGTCDKKMCLMVLLSSILMVLGIAKAYDIIRDCLAKIKVRNAGRNL